jgi:hypothetical protein
VTHSQQSALGAARRSEIISFDPPLPAVSPAYAAEPLLALANPPIELTTWRPCSRLDEFLVRVVWIWHTAVFSVATLPEPDLLASPQATK